jgi:hypothetical protein
LSEKRTNCVDTEWRSIELDTIGEEDLFNLNTDLMNTLVNDLPAYPRPSNDYTYKLSYQNYPLWTF